MQRGASKVSKIHGVGVHAVVEIPEGTNLFPDCALDLKDIKKMGYKPFIVGFVAMLTVGIISISTIEIYLEFFI